MFCVSEIAVRSKNAQRNRQVETGALFAHVSRREIDRSFLEWKEESAVVDGGANALARFPHRQIGQANNYDGRRLVDFVAGRREINFDVHEVSIDSINGCGLCAEEHGE